MALLSRSPLELHMLNENLKAALTSSTNHQDLLEVMEYAVIPAGKLFRPRIVEALAHDLGSGMDSSQKHLASALELHHAYTLVHDDLPAMDNDLIRRGKPSTHAAFGEWKAILAGDALLISSFEELMKMKHPKAIEIHRLFTWATGAKGLVSGQFLDLKAEGKSSLSEVIRIHELKTGRLIQIATVGSYLLTNPSPRLRGIIDYLRLGREIGVSFQLLDDLNELTDEVVSAHEKDINPFLFQPNETLKELQLSIKRLNKIIHENRLSHLEKMLNDYFKKNQSNLESKFEILEKNLAMKNSSSLKEWITTFA